MLGLLLILLGFVVFFVLLGRFAVVFAARRFGKLTSGRHREAEYILETGKAPPTWVRRAPGAAADNEHLRRRLLRNLDQLARHFARAPVFEDESARALFLQQLETVRSGWASTDVGLILSPGDTPWPPPGHHDNDQGS